jgi:hypothetical protein
MILMLDTNAFMHSRLFSEVDRPGKFGAEQVRLVLPLLVLDGLDDKTFSPDNRLSKRADKVLRAPATRRPSSRPIGGCGSVAKPVISWSGRCPATYGCRSTTTRHQPDLRTDNQSTDEYRDCSGYPARVCIGYSTSEVNCGAVR